MARRPDPAQLVSAFSTSTAAIRRRVLAYVLATWNGLDSWRAADIDRFAARAIPAVQGGQRHLASLTDGYLAAMERAVLGTAAKPIGIPAAAISFEAIRGVSAVDVYRRMGPTVWTALSRGTPLQSAVHEGLARALVTAGTDLQLARTHATVYALERNDNVTGYERVPDGEACELCLLASTQRYHSDDLMPIHDRCACDVEPLFEDRGQVVHPGLLDKLNTGSLDEARQMYQDRVAVEQHGELGPVLTVAGQHFTGPGDI